jgi:nitroreductase
MDVMEAIRERRSVRAYQEKPVAEDILLQVLEAGRLAPSANNRQPWTFVVVRDEAKRLALARAASQDFIAEAPVIIAAVALEYEKEMTCEVPAYAVDLAIAADHMTLAAVKFNLGTCWIGAFSQDRAREILDVPDDCRIVTLLPLGYPADSPRQKIRKSLDEVVSYDTLSP